LSRLYRSGIVPVVGFAITLLLSVACGDLLVADTPSTLRQQVEKLCDEGADESVQTVAGDSLNKLAKEHGFKTFGALVKAIPFDDWAAAAGAAEGGDSQSATQNFTKGLLKTLAAFGAEAATVAVVGTSSTVAAPLAASIAAAVLTGMVFDALVGDAQMDIQDRLKRLREEEAKKTELEKKKFEFDRQMVVGQLVLLQADATSLQLDNKKLIADFAQGHMTREVFNAKVSELNAKWAKISVEYDKVRKQLRGMAPTGLEAQLNELRERHRTLKAQLDASGGHDNAVYTEMKAVYQEYLRVKKQVDAQKAGGK
jgi:hypothetical protein